MHIPPVKEMKPVVGCGTRTRKRARAPRETTRSQAPRPMHTKTPLAGMSPTSQSSKCSSDTLRIKPAADYLFTDRLSTPIQLRANLGPTWERPVQKRTLSLSYWYTNSYTFSTASNCLRGRGFVGNRSELLDRDTAHRILLVLRMLATAQTPFRSPLIGATRIAAHAWPD